MKEFIHFYVNYIEPSLKYFAFFLAVMFVLSFWSKAKDGKLLDVAHTLFQSTIMYTYKGVYYFFLGLYLLLNSIVRGFRVIFATVRDFFMSRI